MRPWDFFREVICRAFKPAWSLATVAHFLIILSAGVSVILGIHFGENELIVVPFAVLVVAFLCAVLWHAFTLFREAEQSYARREGVFRRRIEELEVATAPPALSTDARRLLLTTSEPGASNLFYFWQGDGPAASLMVNGKEWLTDSTSHREIKHWESVFTELLNAGLIQGHRGDHETFELTSAGYQEATRLRGGDTRAVN